jgi:hypothetical protein
VCGCMVVEQEGGWTHKDGFPGGGSEGIKMGGPPPHTLFHLLLFGSKSLARLRASFQLLHPEVHLTSLILQEK